MLFARPDRGAAQQQEATAPSPISPARLREDLFRLADDSMMGREPGSLGDFKAAAYVADRFRRLGLRPAGDSGTYFQRVPLGTFQSRAFWITAVLFALEHGPYWDVGLATGAIYNWWMVRTRSVEDCIWAHAVTNGCLSAFVVSQGRWEYWL